MKLSYLEIKFIIKSYKRFNGDLRSVKSSFQIKTGNDISYRNILKVISNVNDLMRISIKNHDKNINYGEKLAV